MQLIDDLVPEHAGLHHVALLHRRDLVAALLRELERDAGDALDLVGVVDLGVDRALLAVAEIGDGLGLAEIDAAGQFPQDDDVEPVHHVALEAGGVRQRGIADRRPDIREQAEILAQPQQAGLRPHVIGHAVPFRPADRAEDDGVGRVRLGHGLVGDRDLVGVIAGTADEPFLGLEPPHAARVHPGDEFLHLGHHLGADAVAGEKKELVGRHVLPSSLARMRGLLKAAARLCKTHVSCPGLADAAVRLGHEIARNVLASRLQERMKAMAQERPKVVIVGAGFGGLVAAKTLARAPVDVTLIDRQNYHCFQPLLYQVATAALSPAEIAWPIRHILRQQENATVLMAEVTGVDSAGAAGANQRRSDAVRLSGHRHRGDAFLFRSRRVGDWSRRGSSASRTRPAFAAAFSWHSSEPSSRTTTPSGSACSRSSSSAAAQPASKWPGRSPTSRARRWPMISGGSTRARPASSCSKRARACCPPCRRICRTMPRGR